MPVVHSIGASDKVHVFISVMSISSPNSMLDRLLESTHRDDSNKWSNVGFSDEITQAVSIGVNLYALIWGSTFYIEDLT